MSADTEGYSCRLLSHEPNVVRVWVVIDRFGKEVAGPAFNTYPAARRHVEDLNAAVHAARFAA